MESKNNPIDSNNILPIDSPKKDIVGFVSEEICSNLRTGLKDDSVDEDGGGQGSKVVNDGAVATARGWKMPPGFCRKCYITLDIDLDGRGGMWIDPDGKGRVVVDGWGLCEDCEYTKSVETDPNWGRSRRISSEERSQEAKFDSSDCDEVSSSTPSKKKQ